MSVEPHRFAGHEFKLGKVEIGHIHSNGMVDIPFTRRIREQPVTEGHAEHHHLLTDSGWITFYIRTAAPTPSVNLTWKPCSVENNFLL